MSMNLIIHVDKVLQEQLTDSLYHYFFLINVKIFLSISNKLLPAPRDKTLLIIV